MHMSCEEFFLAQLRERGFRLTPQREMVLSVMHQVEGWVTADEVYERVQAISSSVDISTVYRTLELLQDFNMVAVVEPGDGQRRYELLGVHGPHLHLICQRCGAVVGMPLDPLRDFESHVAQQYHFQLDSEHLTLPGWCVECRNSKGDQE
jgi:Fur family ferric uptake transcriptional regulator